MEKIKELSIIQKTYDLIKWYVPLLNRLPRNHKFLLGDRIISGLYDLLDGLILARYSREKQPILEKLNALLDVLRYQSRLLKDFGLIKVERYEYASQLITEIGQELGGWIKQQSSRRGKTSPPPDPSSTGRGEAEQITIMAQLP